MTEGTVPVPPHRPCAERDTDVVPVRGGIAFGGATAAGVKPPGAFRLVIGHFFQSHSFLFI